ncbi:Toluene efflux pump periplasmic linker protein TtgA precursor [Posidoniimonas polymericola]|uniref:Toluene efflux pump periplasmic linker protein TtgA n=1 Tax=Posidoniimonas polymericola TaxID=2528002 RepID=A0A5C5Y219_9BACT|nr:efflux RND transporter periplasmic adaptor subunit [Posidoniimonas polymericola]TWT67592.1 Toluene efflux pump periplasmic linker protein TtgA precursor [Posidoniimonas polymericola]
MTEVAKKVGQYVVLIVITVFACGVMWYVSSRGAGVHDEGAGVARPAVAARSKALVSVAAIRPEVTELTVKQSGKIRAWEDYSLGFETAGRVLELGLNDRGEPLDEGDQVQAGQMLARLDDRIYAARRAEAVANLEQAASDLRRDRRLFEQGRGALTEAEYQDTLTRQAVAKAQLEVATKNLEDSVLVSPVNGTISRRMIEAGESVAAHSTVFEVVENDNLLLVVDVPESRVRELEARMREVRQASSDNRTTDPEEKVFRARVHLEGRDAFGNRPPAIDAEVHQIAQVADDRTKLFEVEVRIDNSERLLRPGMVATAELVTKRILAYRVPDVAVMFRGGAAFLFTVREEPTPVEALFWQVGQADLRVANRVDLDQWVDQGEAIIVPAENLELRPVVTRGQQRLTDGQFVRVVNPDALHGASDADATASLPARGPAVASPEVK